MPAVAGITGENGAGTVQLGKTATTVSADGLSTTVLTYLDAATSPDRKVTDVKVINADGSTTETAMVPAPPRSARPLP